jgi:carbonic anhydrase
MSLLDDIILANKEFVAKKTPYPKLTKSPQKQIAIFTCMDTRLVEFLEPALGIGRGDAKILKNAGNTIVDPKGGVIRSLVVAIFLLGVDEVIVIGHKDCGMGIINADELEGLMIERGIAKQAIDEMDKDLRDWVGAFANPEDNVANVVDIIRNSPLIPKDVPIHGLVFNPDDAHLDVIVDGYTQGETK